MKTKILKIKIRRQRINICLVRREIAGPGQRHLFTQGLPGNERNGETPFLKILTEKTKVLKLKIL
jgi:hypothetical protein